MTQREASRKEWVTPSPPCREEINSGSLQRIADATEKMAADYDRMRYDRDYFERRYKEEFERRKSKDRQIYALRGVITKLKRKGGTNG